MLGLWAPPVELERSALDRSQVSERVTFVRTYSAVYATGPIPLGWTSPFKRAELVMNALGGGVEPDAVDRQALAGAVRALSRPADRVRRFRGALPIEI
jgi:hypothetical protein